MPRWNPEWLLELKQFFLEHGRWVDGFFQVLFVLEDVKPGVALQQDSRQELRQLSNILRWFGLYVSTRHGGYATKSEALYYEWNRFFGFKEDAERFLGYPRCCVANHNSQEAGLRFFLSLYSSIKQVKAGRLPARAFRAAALPLLVLHHIPCSMECRESLEKAQRFEAVLKKYRWLVADLLPELYKQMAAGVIEKLEQLGTQGVLKDPAFKQNLRYGKQLLLVYGDAI